MRINGKECMYRSFVGYNVVIKFIRNDNDEIGQCVQYIDGDKFTGTQDILNTAKDTFNRENPGATAYKTGQIEKVSRKIAMRLEDFINYGFEVDDSFKPVEK